MGRKSDRRTCYEVQHSIKEYLLEEMPMEEALAFVKHVRSCPVCREELEEYYKGLRSQVKGENIKNPVSKTLITKILMGTLGCVPAYDEYFIRGMVKEKVAKGTYCKESVKALAKFYEKYNEKFDAERSNWRVEDIEYPQMKLLDMGFWQMGKNIKY